MLHKVRKNFPEQRWDSFGGGAIKVKVENILKSSLDSIPSPSPSVKIHIMGRKVCLRCKSETLMGIGHKLLNFWFSEFCRHAPAMFCLITSSKVSCPQFEFSLKVKVMQSNTGYFLKSFLLYHSLWCTNP